MPDENNRSMPGSEHVALEGFLDDQREAVIRKIEGLDDATARKAPTASALSLLGIVKHPRTLRRQVRTAGPVPA